MSGGTDKNSFRLSLGYNYDGSTLQHGNNNNRRYNFRLNDTYKFSKRMKLDSSIGYSRQEQVAPTNIASALTSSLPQPGLPMATLDGKAYAWGTWGSPVAKVEQGGDNKLTVSSISISETLNYDITSWLTANVNMGYNTSSAWRNIVNNAIDYYNITGEYVTLTDPVQAKSYYQQTNSRTDFYSVSGYVNAHRQWGDHNLSATLGTQYEFKDYTYFGVKATDIQEGLEIINGTGDVTIAENERYQNAILSYFGRVNYDYKERYLLELIGRYDGSSKFLPSNRWAFFWGVSAGWRINEEAWMKNVKWVNNLKLRASYAQVGNQSGIGNYDGVQLYNLESNTGAYVGSTLLSYTKTNGTFASKTRSWERIKNYNLALAEWKFGAGRGTQNMEFLTFGTGLGAGLIINGALYSGTNDNAGELGHIRLSKFGPVGYGKVGSFEGFASGGGITQSAKMFLMEKFQKGESVEWCKPEDINTVTAKMVAEAANAGDELAIKIYKVSAEYLGLGLSILIDILNPEMIVIGSIFTRSEHLIRPFMQKVIDEEALSYSNQVCKIMPAALGEKIGDYAALSVASNLIV